MAGGTGKFHAGNRMEITNKCTGSMDQIAKRHNQIGESNGSVQWIFQHQMGACTWIIESETATDCIEGSMEMPGSPGDHSSFQSKAVG